MNRRAFTQFLAISGLAPLGWAEGALKYAGCLNSRTAAGFHSFSSRALIQTGPAN